MTDLFNMKDYDVMIGYRKNKIKELQKKRQELFIEETRIEGEINLLIKQRDNDNSGFL